MKSGQAPILSNVTHTNQLSKCLSKWFQQPVAVNAYPNSISKNTDENEEKIWYQFRENSFRAAGIYM